MKKRSRKVTDALPGDSRSKAAACNASPDLAQLPELARELETYIRCADEAEQWDLGQAGRTLLHLVQIAECSIDDPSARESLDEMLEFIEQYRPAMDGGDAAQLADLPEQARVRWGDMLDLLGDGGTAGPDEVYDFSEGDEGVEDLPPAQDASQQIDMVLSLLGNAESITDGVLASPEQEETFATASGSPTTVPAAPGDWTVPEHLRSSAELCEAFMDDANRCLVEMESVVLDGASYANDQERCRVFCRQLHTIKGAAASVGLEALAGYLHEVEEWLQHSVDQAGCSLDDELLLTAVDSVRQQTALLENPAAPARAGQAHSGSQPADPVRSAPSTSLNSAITSGEQSVRVRASQLDRLMDMLAELVVIRNRREACVTELSRCNDELGRCSNRIRRFGDETVEWLSGKTRSATSPASAGGLLLGYEPSGKNALDEVASDVATISRELSETFQPLSEENTALSQFIRQFRQELMQLRRLPVAGLFQRLKRAIHDVARLEEKQVEIRLEGEDTGLEQSIQERLFEPLLHMVRNSVSHGIETPDVRQKNRKPAQGMITLRARASASMLTIVVSDDGKGLDYDALRRRGFERGLLAPGSNPSRQHLAKLIFHPGFSTRETASQVSGRGVGMDVVATTIDRMQGRIEVDSKTGAGTSIQISIPLTTGIEHVMVYRAGGQLFALPMRSIQAADHQSHADTRIVPFARAIGLTDIAGSGETARDSARHTLMLDERLGLRIDEVVGPDEVVVRPLPEVLRRHPLVGGVVLSASGETVLLLNADRAREWCQAIPDAKPLESEPASSGEPVSSPAPASGPPVRRALVVDDSLSARMILARKLKDRGFSVDEASDGLAALASLRTGQFEYLFTDLDMPRMGGLELLGEVHQGEFSGMTTIVVSSRPQEEIWKRATENGAAGFLPKPVSGESLDSLLRQVKQNQALQPTH